jgi:hypothetical protein
MPRGMSFTGTESGRTLYAVAGDEVGGDEERLRRRD